MTVRWVCWSVQSESGMSWGTALVKLKKIRLSTPFFSSASCVRVLLLRLIQGLKTKASSTLGHPGSDRGHNNWVYSCRNPGLRFLWYFCPGIFSTHFPSSFSNWKTDLLFCPEISKESKLGGNLQEKVFFLIFTEMGQLFNYLLEMAEFPQSALTLARCQVTCQQNVPPGTGFTHFTP